MTLSIEYYTPLQPSRCGDETAIEVHSVPKALSPSAQVKRARGRPPKAISLEDLLKQKEKRQAYARQYYMQHRQHLIEANMLNEKKRKEALRKQRSLQ